MKTTAILSFTGLLFAVWAGGCLFDPHGAQEQVDGGGSMCGNGRVERGEECDGVDLAGQTCQSLGFDTGDLVCTESCTLDMDGCHGGVECGDGLAEGIEECDGTDLLGETCESQGFSSGTLGCSAQCALDTSGCLGAPDCGNGEIEPPEQCEQGRFNGRTCESETGHTSGYLRCDAQCRVDTSNCHTCGDDQVDGDEECDGSDLAGMTCATLGMGHNGGELGCDDQCRFVLSGCFTCGDAVCHYERGENIENCSGDCHHWHDISAGKDHTCGILGDRSLWCWGKNDVGQLGNSTFDATCLPAPVAGGRTWEQVSAGGEHTCALDTDWNVWCWGKNTEGQLGDGSNDPSNVPVWVSDVSMVESIDVGDKHSCAVLQAGGTVRCWGKGEDGQLGNGQNENQSSPVAVNLVTDVVQVTAGGGHTCAVDGSNFMRCWGKNNKGQLGDDSNTPSNEPVLVNFPVGLLGVADLSAGKEHTCAVVSGGNAYCWGSGGNGRLGIGAEGDRFTPSQVENNEMTQAQSIAAADKHTCAIDSNDHLYCWGKDDHEQLGNGPAGNSDVPVAVVMAAGPAAAVALSATFNHNCVLDEDGSPWCWGKGTEGQLGGGDYDNGEVPATVFSP